MTAFDRAPVRPGAGQEAGFERGPKAGPSFALRTSNPWGGPSQRCVWVSVVAAKTTLPCLLKGSVASLKCCWRSAPRGVDRVGSLEM